MTAIAIGDRVRVLLPNGYRSTGVVIRLHKNGRVGVREDDGRYYVRGHPGTTIEKIEDKEQPCAAS